MSGRKEKSPSRKTRSGSRPGLGFRSGLNLLLGLGSGFRLRPGLRPSPPGFRSAAFRSSARSPASSAASPRDSLGAAEREGRKPPLRFRLGLGLRSGFGLSLRPGFGFRLGLRFGLGAGLFGAMSWPDAAQAHVSEQALALLLPTRHYIAGGVLSVIASIFLISLVPAHRVARLFAPREFAFPAIPKRLPVLTSSISFLALAGLVAVGVIGPRDPLANLLPLAIWTGWWIILFAAIGLIGNLWLLLNPWTGPFRLAFGGNPTPLIRLPDSLGAWPGFCVFLAYAVFYTVDPAPDDPDRLALLVASYWTLTFACMRIFGAREWIGRGEAFSILFELIARVSPFGRWSRPAVGMPGWNLNDSNPLPASLGVFALAILAAGSFDGLKETFRWLGAVGVNPLEFPGRTAMMGSSFAGILLSVLLLPLVFWGVAWAGGLIANRGRAESGKVAFGRIFRTLAPTVLPIALGYHASHFLIAFLVNGQYLLAAIGDPLAGGANLLGLADRHVTAGFLSHSSSVRVIWLTQAGLIVSGHVVSVLAAHHAALILFGSRKRAALSQIPLGLFMVLYTLFGLWLLAAPKGA